MQRRKVRRQGPESADERLDRALREILSQPTVDGVLEGDRGQPASGQESRLFEDGTSVHQGGVRGEQRIDSRRKPHWL